MNARPKSHARGEPARDARSKLRERIVEEAKRFVVMFLYLWLLFGLFVLNERIILGQRGIHFASQGFALINALVLAKVMLIADHLNFDGFTRSRPLIYSILLESFFLTVLFVSFHIIEHVVIGLFYGESLQASIPAIGGGGYAGLASVALILFVVLIPFFGFRNVRRVLGPDRLNAMLFGTRISTAEAPSRPGAP